MNTESGISPQVVKFLVALTVVTLLVAAIERVSSTAAWVLVLIIVLGLLLNNPLAIGFITLGANSLRDVTA